MKTCLVLTDFSPENRAAALFAAAFLNQTGGGKLIFYHTFYDNSHDMIIMIDVFFPAPDLDEKRRSAAHSWIDELVKEIRTRYGEKFHFESILNEQPLLDGIQGIVKQDVQITVISGLKKTADNSGNIIKPKIKDLIAERHHATMLVPMQNNFGPISEIVVACSLQYLLNENVAEKIMDMAFTAKADLHIINIDDDDAERGVNNIDKEECLQKTFRPALAKFHYVGNNDISHEIETAIADMKNPLLITLPQRRNVIERLFHESLSEKLIMKMSVPVLLIHQNEN